MPDAPDTTIAAVALDTNHVGPNNGDGNVTQVVALVKDGQVLAATRSTIEQDVLTQVGSYRIDTAPYWLSPDVRAFGVIFDSSARGASCPDATADEELTLYVRDGSSLRPVFGTNREGWVAVDPDACDSAHEGARSESANMTIAVEKTSSHGFADLALTAHIARTKLKNHDWVDLGTRTKRIVLHYNGKTYGIDMFRTFWYPADSMMTRGK